MTSQANNPQVEENYYQILEVQKTASLVEIRYAYEGKLLLRIPCCRKKRLKKNYCNSVRLL